MAANMPSATLAETHRLAFSAPAPERPRFVRFPGAIGEASGAGVLHLRRALREDGLVLHFQPILELATGRVRHYEALVRMRGKIAGSLLAPSSFLPGAERSGLVLELDRAVLRGALRALEGSDVQLAVNLSAISVSAPGTLAHLEGALAQHAVAPERLLLEITETAAIGEIALARAFCEGVQALGCRVALDDFGAGCSSLQYLTELSYDVIKIDGRFIRDLARCRRSRVLVKALAQVARALGKETVAEFVGDLATIELLRMLGVDHAQGYAVGRPRGSLGGTHKRSGSGAGGWPID
jgi:EAL domain-containing protein (putative c-di-GMP-specific phosphodiesterase class I)